MVFRKKMRKNFQIVKILQKSMREKVPATCKNL